MWWLWNSSRYRDEVAVTNQPDPQDPLLWATEDEQFLEAPVLGKEFRADSLVSTDPWRVLRIMGEFVEGFDRLADVTDGVSFFGSARTPEDHPHYVAAVETARLLSAAGVPIITGGGPGIMEAANRGAQKGGGLSIGCNIELPFEQLPNDHIDRLINFRYFFVRKTMFVKYATAFIVFPGGFGTMDELFEALTLIQTGKVRIFPLVLFGRDYWADMLEWLKKVVLGEQYIAAEDLDLMTVTDDPEEVKAVIMRARETRSRLGDKRRGAELGR